jgi:hypothetical protein
VTFRGADFGRGVVEYRAAHGGDPLYAKALARLVPDLRKVVLIGPPPSDVARAHVARHLPSVEVVVEPSTVQAGAPSPTAPTLPKPGPLQRGWGWLGG